MLLNDTIAAVSTPRGKGGIAVIRISGQDTDSVVARVFAPFGGAPLASREPRLAVYGNILSPEDGAALDSGIAVRYKAPASYTGEDMTELSCHGGVYVTRAVLSAVFAAGARPAEAGEFTRRAFLNGKLTLTEAEAVGELLDADTEDRMRLASSAVGGRLSGKLSELSWRLTSVMSALYAAIDYPEEDIGDEGERQIGGVMESVRDEISSLLSTYKRGRAVADGVKCVICGRPNAGKSSLYNLICGDEAAIVTDVEGTTRDVLRTCVSFGGVTLNLSDTAGLRDTSDTVESIGVRLAEREMESAELLLCVFDGSTPISSEELEMIKSYPKVPRIAVLNKSDKGHKIDPETERTIKESHDAVVKLSCTAGDGLTLLAKEVGELFDAGLCDISRDPVIWSARQEATLRRAGVNLDSAIEALASGDPLDAVCTLCESAAAELGETDGRGISEDIVSGIFSRFCVGK